MKGNKQIELKAQRYLYERAHLSGSCVVTTFDPFDLEQAFIDGAEWQKEQTSEQAMKYLQEHHSPSELSDFQAAMNIAVAKAIASTINKAVEWLKGNIHYDENGEGNMEWVVFFGDDDEMIDNFKRYMED